MSDDRDRLDRLSSTSSAEEETADNGTPIPIQVEADPGKAVEEALQRAEEETRQGRDIVREYREKYYGDEPTARQRLHAEALANQPSSPARKRKPAPSYMAVGLSDDERLWAALAHASVLLTLGVAIVTGGLGALLLLFVPLGIYFAYRDRSNFVAFHALQAFAMQIIGTVGWVALLVVGILTLAAGIVISALASVVLVGIPFLLVFIVLLIAFIPLSLALPLAMLVFSIIGAINTYNGNDYRYPIIADWIDQQFSSDVIML